MLQKAKVSWVSFASLFQTLLEPVVELVEVRHLTGVLGQASLQGWESGLDEKLL